VTTKKGGGGGKKDPGPSASELRLRSELGSARREIEKLRKEQQAGAPGARPPSSGPPPPPPPPPPPTAPPEAGVPTGAPAGTGPNGGLLGGPPVNLDPVELQRQIHELTTTRQRLSRLYFSQVEENRKRAQKLHEILENISRINSNLDLDSMLRALADTIRQSLGFGMVLVRLREPGTNRLRARAFAGINANAQAQLQKEDVVLEDFLSWMRDEFKVSRSYFIGHAHEFNAHLPKGYKADLGAREEWEWNSEDVLLVPLFNRQGELTAYFSVDDPIDRLVPSSESIELLEIFGHHAVVAIENSRLYHKLEEHSRELEEANQRMQEMHALKSNFVSAVSHELRTPLTAIRAYVDTLLASRDGEIPREQLDRFLNIINEESQRLARLIESVLDLNRFDSGAMRVSRQAMDLSEVLVETGRLLEPVARAAQVDLKVAQELADTRVDADRDQMRQLLLHLGSNAVKFTPPGGSVTMRLVGDARDVTLQVEDTGIGIPEEALDRIFERFYQVDSSLVRKYGGTGLGLAICKSIVEWHGGRLFVESKQGEGSKFTVTLPRRTGPRVVVRPEASRPAASEDVLRLALEMVAEVMGARVVSLLSPEDDGSLIVEAAIGLDDRIIREARIRPGSGVAGWVAEHRRPVCVSGNEGKTEVETSGRRQYRSGTFLSVPLEGERGFVGVLNVTDPVAERPFDAEDCHLLLHLAERVATAWDQARTMEQTTEDVQGTARALRQVLQHLDRGRRRAPDRVRLARALARELGLSESEVGVVSFAATIHDVGMNQVGEGVVSSGSLTPEQRLAVEQHPERGVEMLKPLESLGVVRDVVLSHHEWWDGSGYPRGLKNEAIPIGGRILAVVDAWESMIVGRAHRESIPKADALLELHRLKGRQFDPRVVDAFERTLARLDREPGATASKDTKSETTTEGR
jgi:signal transduction histidine kinase/response regulator RpfG family c-di-GMP phosphodiesterase